MKKFVFMVMISILTSLVYGQFLKENESHDDFTQCYAMMDWNINVRAEPKLSSPKIGLIERPDDIYVNPTLSNVKEKIGNYEGYWLRCYVPKLKIYGYVFSEFFEFRFAHSRASKLPTLVDNDTTIDPTQLKGNNYFISDNTGIKVNLPNAKEVYETVIADNLKAAKTEIAYINEEDNIYILRHYWYEGFYYIFYLGKWNISYKTIYPTVIYNEDKTKMALFNNGSDMWGTTELAVFDSETGTSILKLELGGYDSIVDFKWEKDKIIIYYDKLVRYPGGYIPAVAELKF